ncbi:MAG: hypothetical protein ACI9C4_001269 [Paraglaciecola sp.]|jgi:hypothetical protein
MKALLKRIDVEWLRHLTTDYGVNSLHSAPKIFIKNSLTQSATFDFLLPFGR